VQSYLDAGVECVVLAFDDYQHVPSAKYMTQVPVSVPVSVLACASLTRRLRRPIGARR
jgi:hypothetical protein